MASKRKTVTTRKSKSKNQNNNLVVGIVVLFALIAGWLLLTYANSAVAPVSDALPVIEETGEVHEISVKMGSYYYDVEEIRVKAGDRVRITVESVDGFHDLVIDEFDVETQRLRPSEGTDTVEFVADKVGTFEYYCSVGEHRALGQIGTLIVE